MKKYAVRTEWCYHGEDQFDRCIIGPATPEMEEFDGENCITGSGRDGFTFDIYDSLEEALVRSQYKPVAMDLTNLSNAEKKEAEEILSHYLWDDEKGLVKRSHLE